MMKHLRIIAQTILSTTAAIIPKRYNLNNNYHYYYYRNTFIQVLSRRIHSHHIVVNNNKRIVIQPQLLTNKLQCTTTVLVDHTRSLVTLRGGGGDIDDAHNNNTAANSTTSTSTSTTSTLNTTQQQQQQYTVLAEPAPGTPFHHAFPVHDLELAKEFYGTILGCVEGRSSTKWQDYSLHGHQIVAHYVGDTYRCQDYYNPVDGDEVPVPHTGLALTVDQFHSLAERLQQANVPFIIPPHLRFIGQPGEQYTMFFKDPSGNNLEFKAMTHPENLFAKYNVVDH